MNGLVLAASFAPEEAGNSDHREKGASLDRQRACRNRNKGSWKKYAPEGKLQGVEKRHKKADNQKYSGKDLVPLASYEDVPR
jgi:hypothetical protein